MVNICNSEQHVVLMRILDARNRPSITPDMPLWKLKLTEEEYTNLKETLAQNAYRLEDFGIEADIKSDCAPLWKTVEAVMNRTHDLHVIRDATRGGVGTVLYEIAKQSR